MESIEELNALEVGEDYKLILENIIICRISGRSIPNWFDLKELRGCPIVRSYDISWTEWRNLVAAPIEK